MWRAYLYEEDQCKLNASMFGQARLFGRLFKDQGAPYGTVRFIENTMESILHAWENHAR